MGGLLLRRSGGAAGQDTAPMPITWQPAWLVHTERGDAGGGVAELGALLPLPAYGLALGGDIGSDATLEDLAAAYAQARVPVASCRGRHYSAEHACGSCEVDASTRRVASLWASHAC